jgi:hypothetical protein
LTQVVAFPSWKACEGGYRARTLALDVLHPLDCSNPGTLRLKPSSHLVSIFLSLVHLVMDNYAAWTVCIPPLSLSINAEEVHCLKNILEACSPFFRIFVIRFSVCCIANRGSHLYWTRDRKMQIYAPISS